MLNNGHWEHLNTTEPSDSVSWYQAHAEQSLRLIQPTGVPRTASIIDVGGGASTLVDDLLLSCAAARQFGPSFSLPWQERKAAHHTPFVSTQSFVYGACRVEDPDEPRPAIAG